MLGKSVCECKNTRVRSPGHTLTHEGASAAYEAEKAAFRRQRSTFTAEKRESRGEGVSVRRPAGSLGSFNQVPAEFTSDL